MRLPILRDGELERWLEAYAAVRLSPDRATASRVRARVMREWDGRAVTAPASLPAIAAVRLGRSRARRVRRVMLPAVAAALGMSVLVGSTLAATPGAPLYGARLWAETLVLPADPVARARAQLARLEQRMAEAVNAAKGGNAAGAAAASAAYREILAVAADEGAASDGTALTLLAPAIERHRAVLAALLDLVPADARAEVAAAIEGVKRVADRLDLVGSRPPAATPAVIPPSSDAPSRSPAPNSTNPAGSADDAVRPRVPGPVATPAPSITPPPATTQPGLVLLPAPTVDPDPPPVAAPVRAPGPTPPPTPSLVPLESAVPEPKPTPAATAPPSAQPVTTRTPDVRQRSPEAPVPLPPVERQPDIPEPSPSPPAPKRERHALAPPAPVASETPRSTREPASSSPPAQGTPSVPVDPADTAPRPSAAGVTQPSSLLASGATPPLPTPPAATPPVATPPAATSPVATTSVATPSPSGS